MKRLGAFGNTVSLTALPLMFCVFLFAFVQCDNGSTGNTTGNNHAMTLVCLGDSLTVGYGATKPGVVDKTKSYPAYLQDKITIPVINAGVNGNTTARALARVDTEVLSQNPQIIIILLGANDLRRGVPEATVKGNFQNILNKVNDGNRKIYLAKFYTEGVARALANRFGLTDYDFQTAMINRYDDLFNALASENDITLIEDIWHGVWEIHMSDPVHPNAKGYEIIANNIFDILQPYLEANNLLKDIEETRALFKQSASPSP